MVDYGEEWIESVLFDADGRDVTFEFDEMEQEDGFIFEHDIPL